MADYWKSNAKKFCEICKIWIADNRVSIENHERGFKHKGMLQQKLRDMGRKARELKAEEIKLNATLSAMEQAAVAAMKNSNCKDNSVPTVSGVPRSTQQLSLKPDPKEKLRERKRKMQELKRTAKVVQFWNADEDKEIVEWVQADSQGQQYYWNIFSGRRL